MRPAAAVTSPVLLLQLLWCLFTVNDNKSNGFSSSSPIISPSYLRQNGLWMATSSSDLKTSGKKSGKSSKYPKDSVVSRLKQAVERASAAAAKKEAAKLKNSTRSSRNNQDPFYYELPSADDPYYATYSYYNEYEIKPTQPQIPAVPKEGTIIDLMAKIDQLLESSSLSQQQMNAWHQRGTLYPVQDSMTAILMHNDRVNTTIASSSSSLPSSSIAPTTNLFSRKVAIVLCKPLMDGKYISFEQDVRIRRLVQAIRDQEFLPYLVFFVGSDSATQSMAHFNQILDEMDHNNDKSSSLSSSFNLNRHRHRPKICMAETTSIMDGGLDIVCRYCLADLEHWTQKKLKQDYHRILPHRGRVTVQIQFALVSADYHLCILNDIHARSPNQSFLRCLENWELETDCSTSSSPAGLLLQDASFVVTPKKIIVESSWLYLYAATAGLRYTNNHNDYDDYDDDNSLLCATWYRRVQELIPVLMNLRAVAANREFFQRDNYRALVQVRRSFIDDIEELYHDKSTLAQVRKHLTPPNNKPLDIVLEGALLSMGRCSDLVRPAGLLTGSVATADFLRAVTLLEHAIAQITLACDPDRPLTTDTTRSS